MYNKASHMKFLPMKVPHKGFMQDTVAIYFLPVFLYLCVDNALWSIINTERPTIIYLQHTMG